MEWARSTYNDQYEKWVPWLEDVYLRWFTRDNKASYTAKDTLGQAKVTGIDQVDALQDSTADIASGQLGQEGALQPLGELASQEVLTRSERQGKNDKGGII